jgi:hypothetical protein
LEGGVWVAEGGRLAYFLGFDHAVVALSVADGWDDAAISFEDLALDYCGGGCSGWGWEVRERCLGFPDSCCECLAAYIADNEERHDFLDKNTVVQTECVRIQVEVSLGRWVVCGLVLGPNDICERRSRFAVLGITEIINIRWIHPQGTSVWHWRHADKAWRASPCRVVAGILGCHWRSIRWFWTSELFGNCLDLGHGCSGRTSQSQARLA